MPWKKLLVAILGLAFAIECLFPIGGFLMPEKALEMFKVGTNPDTLFLGYVSTWCLLFVALACGLALLWVIRDNPAGWTLSYLLGLWWVGIGLSLWLVWGRIDNLFLDALKGALITAFAYRSRPRSRA